MALKLARDWNRDGYRGGRQPVTLIPCGAGGAHHWRIATPAGATSQGVCQKCGETRDFGNGGEYADFSLREDGTVRLGMTGLSQNAPEIVTSRGVWE